MRKNVALSFFKKTFALILAVALAVIPLMSCASPDDAQGESVTYTDALGRELDIERYPSRVAALTGSFAEVWYLSGGEVCAAAEDAWEDFDLPLGDAVNLGGAHSPSIELLISASPDLVIASASVVSNVDLCEVLESVGITVIYFNVDNFGDYLEMLRVCTAITGRGDLFEQNGLAVDRAIREIKLSLAREPISEAKRSVLILRASASSIKAKGSRGTVLGEMLGELGCENIADSDGTILDHLSLEAILREDPYRIFVVTMGRDRQSVEQAVASLISESSAWSSLDAVRGGRIHYMDKTLFNMKPNARWGEAYEELYEILKS